MAVAAPNIPVTGFHAVDVRKSLSPNFAIASEDSFRSTAIIPMMKIITLKDATAVREEKNNSVRFFLGDMANTETFLLD